MRNKRLDILRCIAVLLVITHHEYGQTRLGRAGWVGVDLFFVLSGFLISGLLFVEYKKCRAINWKRFFIRRGLKLYPAFYVLLAVTFLVQVRLHHLSPLGNYLGELLYVQNYGPYIWNHTWSLAVEEHFYIVLPIFLLLLVRLSPSSGNPFQAIPRTFAFVAVICLLSRVITVAMTPPDHLHSWLAFRPVYTSTHDRIDSLFFGVLLGYLHHFRPRDLDAVFAGKRRAIALALLAALLLSACLFVPIENGYMLTVGITFLYLGFGIVLLFCLQVRGILPRRMAWVASRIGAGFAFTGMYSYSIYIWHVAVLAWLPKMIQRIFRLEAMPPGFGLFYFGFCILFGIAMSHLVEYPILRLRDRIFPAIRSPIDLPLTVDREAISVITDS